MLLVVLMDVRLFSIINDLPQLFFGRIGAVSGARQVFLLGAPLVASTASSSLLAVCVLPEHVRGAQTEFWFP